MLKDIAAVIGPIGYTLKGVHKELVKGKKLTAFIRRARMVQGGDDLKELSEGEKKLIGAKIEAAWKIMEEIKRELTLTREEGLEGKVAVMIGKQRLSKQGAFESVETTRKAFLEWKNQRALDVGGGKNGGDDRGRRKMWSKSGSRTTEKRRRKKSVGSVERVANGAGGVVFETK